MDRYDVYIGITIKPGMLVDTVYSDKPYTAADYIADCCKTEGPDFIEKTKDITITVIKEQ